MTMDLSTLKSKNGEKYEDFVTKAKEKKKFAFNLYNPCLIILTMHSGLAL